LDSECDTYSPIGPRNIHVLEGHLVSILNPYPIKLNFDGASKGNLGLTGLGGYFINAQGDVQ